MLASFAGRHRWAWPLIVLVAGTCPVPAAPAPVPSADSPLAVVPADAPFVMHVRGYERTKQRFLTMIGNALPDFAKTIREQIADLEKKALEERQLRSMPPDGSIFLVLLSWPKDGDNPPAVALVIRVNNYAEFRDGLLTGQERKLLKQEDGYEVTLVDRNPVYLVDRGGYAVLAVSKEAAVHFTRKQPGLDTRLSKALARKLLEPDVSVYVDTADAYKHFRDQIGSMRDMVKQLLGAAGNLEGIGLDKTTAELLKTTIEAVFQVAEDSRTLIVTGDFRPEGLALATQLTVGDGTPTARFLKDCKPADLATEVGQLPTGSTYSLAVSLDGPLGKYILPYLQNLIRSPATDNETGKILERLSQAGPQLIAASYDLSARGLEIVRYKDPDTALQASLKLLETFDSNGIGMGGLYLKGKPEVRRNAQVYRGFKFHHVRATWDWDKFVQKLPQGGDLVLPIIKELMGEEINVWVGSDGKVVLQVTARNWDDARKQLDVYLTGQEVVARQPAFQELRKHLSGDANILVVLDLPAYLEVFAKLIRSALRAQGLPIMLPEMKADRSQPGYIGYALRLQPDSGTVEIWLPCSTVRETYRMVEPLIKAAGSL